MYSRRDFGKTALAGISLSTMLSSKLVFAKNLDSTVRGVKLGTITYSFTPIPDVPDKDKIQTIIEDCTAIGAANVELFAGNNFGIIEPILPALGRNGGQVPATITPEYTAAREQLRQWRLEKHLDVFESTKKRFSSAGLNLLDRKSV